MVIDTGKMIKIAVTLLWGVITGQFSYASLRKFLKASAVAGKAKAHYLEYPEDPAGFEEWVVKARALWGE